MSGRHSWGYKLTSIALVKKSLGRAWDELKHEMKGVVPSSDVRPSRADDIFRYSQEGSGVRVEITPVSFRIKEKPQSNTADLFVTIEGNMVFENSNDLLRVIRFHTRAGYFLEKAHGLRHVYGVHYDHDDCLVAHPIFHSTSVRLEDE
jgi:hypothetical protein